MDNHWGRLTTRQPQIDNYMQESHYSASYDDNQRNMEAGVRDILLGVTENKHKKTTIGTYW